MKSKFIKIVIFIIFIASFSSYGQITKGVWMVGGEGSFRTFNREVIETGNQSRYTYLELSPNIGYFVIDKLVFSAKPTFSYNPYEGAYNLGFGIGPFVKYYFLETNRIVNFFAQTGYSFIQNHNNNFGKYHKSSQRTFEIGGGLVIFFNNSVGLELGTEYKATNYNNGIARDKGFQVQLGFQIHLEK